jgi:hypothetical protein
LYFNHFLPNNTYAPQDLKIVSRMPGRCDTHGCANCATLPPSLCHGKAVGRIVRSRSVWSPLEGRCREVCQCLCARTFRKLAGQQGRTVRLRFKFCYNLLITGRRSVRVCTSPDALRRRIASDAPRTELVDDGLVAVLRCGGDSQSQPPPPRSHPTTPHLPSPCHAWTLPSFLSFLCYSAY